MIKLKVGDRILFDKNYQEGNREYRGVPCTITQVSSVGYFFVAKFDGREEWVRSSVLVGTFLNQDKNAIKGKRPKDPFRQNPKIRSID